MDIEPLRPSSPGLEGEVVQFVRIDLLDTDGPRAAEVSRDQYLSLPPEDRGAVDYFLRNHPHRKLDVAWPFLRSAGQVFDISILV